jgi:hypothetical protein
MRGKKDRGAEYSGGLVVVLALGMQMQVLIGAEDSGEFRWGGEAVSVLLGFLENMRELFWEYQI